MAPVYEADYNRNGSLLRDTEAFLFLKEVSELFRLKLVTGRSLIDCFTLSGSWNVP